MPTVRVLQLNILIPIVFFLMCVFLVVLPFFVDDAAEVFVGLVMILSGLPVYFLFVRPEFLRYLDIYQRAENL